MTENPYKSVEVSHSLPGEIVNTPSNGGAVETKLYDEYGNEMGVLMNWRNESGAWINGDNNVRLNEKQ